MNDASARSDDALRAAPGRRSASESDTDDAAATVEDMDETKRRAKRASIPTTRGDRGG
jgi:hypothetical protein